MVDIESSDLLKNPRFSQPIKNDEEEKFKAKSEEDYGYYLLRTNYSVSIARPKSGSLFF